MIIVYYRYLCIAAPDSF